MWSGYTEAGGNWWRTAAFTHYKLCIDAEMKGVGRTGFPGSNTIQTSWRALAALRSVVWLSLKFLFFLCWLCHSHSQSLISIIYAYFFPKNVAVSPGHDRSSLNICFLIGPACADAIIFYAYFRGVFFFNGWRRLGVTWECFCLTPCELSLQRMLATPKLF